MSTIGRSPRFREPGRTQSPSPPLSAVSGSTRGARHNSVPQHECASACACASGGASGVGYLRRLPPRPPVCAPSPAGACDTRGGRGSPLARHCCAASTAELPARTGSDGSQAGTGSHACVKPRRAMTLGVRNQHAPAAHAARAAACTRRRVTTHRSGVAWAPGWAPPVAMAQAVVLAMRPVQVSRDVEPVVDHERQQHLVPAAPTPAPARRCVKRCRSVVARGWRCRGAGGVAYRYVADDVVVGCAGAPYHPCGGVAGLEYRHPRTWLHISASHMACSGQSSSRRE